MATVRQTTAVRFSLRGVLIAVALVAAYCAAVAPTFRAWSRPERVAFLAVWGWAFLGWLGIVGVQSVLRLKAERYAGAVRLTLMSRKSRIAFVAFVFFAIVAAALIIFHAFIAAKVARTHAEAAAMGRTISLGHAPRLGFVLGVMAGMVTTCLWWRGDRIEFCDRGVLNFVRCTPWPAVDYEWILSDPQGLMLCLGHNRIHVIAPEGSRTEVNEMLRRRYASLASPCDDGEDSVTTP